MSKEHEHQLSALEEERRERSIERGANIVELATTLEQGRIPSNVMLKKVIAQSKSGIEEMIEEGERQGTIYPETKEVMEKSKDLLTDAQLFLDLKNRDEKVQRFLQHSFALSQELASSERPRLARIAQHAKEKHEYEYSATERDQYMAFLANARVVLQNLVLSTDFRRLLIDIIEVLRNFFQFGIEEVSKSLEKGVTKLETNEQQEPGFVVSTEQLLASSVGEPIQVKAKQWAPMEVGAGLSQPPVPITGLDTEADLKKILDDLLRVLDQLSRNREWNNAIRSLIGLLDSITEEVKEMSEELEREVKEEFASIYDSYPAQELAIESIAIIEEFTGHGTWKPLITHLQTFVRMLRKDTTSLDFMTRVQAMLFELIEQPSEFRDPVTMQRLQQLLDEGQSLSLRYKWVAHTKDLFESLQVMVKNIVNDPLVNRIAQDTKELIQTLATVEHGGKVVSSAELIEQMKDVFIPVLTEQLKYIPIPPVVDTADLALGTFAYQIENLVFSGQDVLPEHIDIKLDNNLDFNLKFLHTNKSHTTLSVRIRNIRTRLDDVHFAYRRVSAPHIQDSGRANVTVAGDGAELYFMLDVNPPDRPPILRVRRVACRIHNLDIKTHDTKMDFVYNMMSGLFSGTIKRNVEKKVEAQIENIIETINLRLNDIIQLLPSLEQVKQATTATASAAVASTVSSVSAIGATVSSAVQPLTHTTELPNPQHLHTAPFTPVKDPTTALLSEATVEEGMHNISTSSSGPT